MNATELSQVVHDPQHPDQSDELIARLRELAARESGITQKAAFKLMLGEAMHPFGVHTWVRHKVHDPNSDELVDVGIVCWFCPKGRRG